MALSIAHQIVEALKARAEAILTSGGYNTNAGARVYLQRETLDAGDLPCVVIWPQPIRYLSGSIGCSRDMWERVISLEAVHSATPDTVGSVCEELIADLHEAIFGPGDDSLGGLATEVAWEEAEGRPRGDGAYTAGAVLSIRIRYACGHGNPYGVD